mgnify:CR=1 FL=1
MLKVMSEHLDCHRFVTVGDKRLSPKPPGLFHDAFGLLRELLALAFRLALRPGGSSILARRQGLDPCLGPLSLARDRAFLAALGAPILFAPLF